MLSLVSLLHKKITEKEKLQPSTTVGDGNSGNPHAETIFNILTQKIDEMGLLQLQILSLMASDGPAVMTGAHSGVTVHLKLVNSQVITFHCFGYKLALPYTDITSDNSYIKNIKLWLKQQWKMFETHNSGWQCI